MLKTITSYEMYLTSLEGSGAAAGLGASIVARFPAKIYRYRIKTNYTGQHLSLKIQNNAINTKIKLISFGLATSKLPARNVKKMNALGSHISLKFQNNTVDTPFQLQTIGLDVKELAER